MQKEKLPGRLSQGMEARAFFGRAPGLPFACLLRNEGTTSGHALREDSFKPVAPWRSLEPGQEQAPL